MPTSSHIDFLVEYLVHRYESFGPSKLVNEILEQTIDAVPYRSPQQYKLLKLWQTHVQSAKDVAPP